MDTTPDTIVTQEGFIFQKVKHISKSIPLDTESTIHSLIHTRHSTRNDTQPPAATRKRISHQKMDSSSSNPLSNLASDPSIKSAFKSLVGSSKRHVELSYRFNPLVKPHQIYSLNVPSFDFCTSFDFLQPAESDLSLYGQIDYE